MDLIEGLLTRRSVRAFTAEPVSREQVLAILRAGSFAPSGLNNQPWRFAVVFDAAVRGWLAQLTATAGSSRRRPCASRSSWTGRRDTMK